MKKKKVEFFDLQTKLTILLATVVLVINCYTLSATFVEVNNNNYAVSEEE